MIAVIRRGGLVLALTAGLLSCSGSALAGPVFTEAAQWNQPVTATGGGWWTSQDGGVTIAGKANADFPALAHLQTGYCNPFGPATQLVGASLTRVRWHDNANDMSAYMRFIAPNGSDLGVWGGQTSLASTRRYLYGYVPEGVNLELQKGALTTDSYTFDGGQCVFGGVLFNGAGSNGTVDTSGFAPLLTNRLDSVTVEDLQGPAVANPTTWGSWITGDQAPIEWDASDNAYRRGTTGARVLGGGQVDLGDPPNGHHGAWVPVGALPDGDHSICGYRVASGWAEVSRCVTFRLDRTNPAPPTISLHPDTSGAWTNGTVIAQADATSDGTGSGWDRNQFSVDGGPWTDGPTSVALTTEGDHTVAARAVDRSGRVGSAAAESRVRIDLTAPTIAAASVAGTTGVLTWSMSDGVGFGACPVTVDLSGPGTRGAQVRVYEQRGASLHSVAAVHLPLDTMPNGRYEARLTVCDLAGNVRTSQVPFTWTGNPDGAIAGAAARFVAAELVSPGTVGVRDVSGVQVPVIRRVYNRWFGLRGRLRHPDGSPFPGVTVELRDTSDRYRAGARSDDNGNFMLFAHATVGGAWTLNPAGSSLRQPVAWLQVRPIVRVRIRTDRVRRALVATGTLAPSIGVGGKAIQLQWFDSATRRWRPVVDGRIRGDGTFRLAYRFQRPGRYRVPFRVIVRTDGGWPFLAAKSRVVTVAVR